VNAFFKVGLKEFKGLERKKLKRWDMDVLSMQQGNEGNWGEF
jgi:hypothetical protein